LDATKHCSSKHTSKTLSPSNVDQLNMAVVEEISMLKEDLRRGTNNRAKEEY